MGCIVSESSLFKRKCITISDPVEDVACFIVISKIRIVLIETSHPGNIGAAARAMKTMGLSELALVRPKQYPCADATARAAGADDVLANAIVVETLEEALKSCTRVFGTSARLRSLRWPVDSPREAAEQIAMRTDQGRLAVVFGRERSGLTNDELTLCQRLIHIPVDPGFFSLNLASAVQIVSYEMRMALLDTKIEQAPEPGESPAPTEIMQGFFTHLEETLINVGYLNPEDPRYLMPRLRRLFYRAMPTHNEINILRGILKLFSIYKKRGV
jgi:tRNA/rRNA methyltransferase/tRNA (cytidine32/uridine32-2'-O)-methyltransferase